MEEKIKILELEIKKLRNAIIFLGDKVRDGEWQNVSEEIQNILYPNEY